MVDTPRTSTAFVTLFAPNSTGAIGAQQMLDFNVSVHNIVPTIVSAGGVNQGGATILTLQTNVVTVCLAGAGVMATANYTQILNRTTNSCLVYPISGARFEAFATNAAVSIQPGGSAEFFMTSITQGYIR